jgi:hypothetical protein
MKRAILGAMLLFLAGGTAIADTCKDRATAKNLAGAALTSFMKKCQADATKSCDTTATAKNLSGAAKTSFTKKCIQTAVGK